METIMEALDIDLVNQYVNDHIDTFHQDRIRLLSKTTLSDVLKKNPYLSRAKNVTKASELIEGALAARLSSSEEELFGVFLEDLAIYVARQTTKGHKSGAEGVDLEFDEEGCHYFVSIKSGSSWGNADAQNKQQENLQNAVQVYKQNKGQKAHVDAVLGICYGKTRTTNLRGYLKLVGQNFWTFISGNRNLYKDIIEPIGYKAKEHNESYLTALGNVTNRLTAQFIQEYCNEDGSINWGKLVEATCGNYDLDRHGFDY